MSRFSVGETVRLRISCPEEEAIIVSQHPLHENCYEVIIKDKNTSLIVHQGFIEHMFGETDEDEINKEITKRAFRNSF